MFSPLRNRFGIPGVISVIALVFALVGGAYAAENSGDGAAASAKKNNRAKKKNKGVTIQQVRRIARQEARKFAGQGPIGPQGLPGVPGAPGTDGDDGSDGGDGKDGTDGKSVLSGEGPPSAETGTDGDFYIDAEANEIYGPKELGVWGAGTPLEGSPWTAGGTLPQGARLTGGWVFGPEPAGGPEWVAIPFAIPLAAPLGSTDVDFMELGETNTECPGTVEDPQVVDHDGTDGQLCVYAADMTDTMKALGPSRLTTGNGADITGARLLLAATANNGNARGTFAVVGPAAP
jgi:hypothetical protein